MPFHELRQSFHFARKTVRLSYSRALNETKLNPQDEEEPASGNEPKQESQTAAAEDVAVADEAPSKAEPARRGPGRPKGSLKQKTLERMTQAEEERRNAEAFGLKVEEPVKRKPDLPKGSKNTDSGIVRK